MNIYGKQKLWMKHEFLLEIRDPRKNALQISASFEFFQKIEAQLQTISQQR